MDILIATGNAKLDGALYASLNNCTYGVVSNSSELIEVCIKEKPSLVIVSNKLTLIDNLCWRNILPLLKQKCPETRFIFIDNTLRKEKLEDKYFVQTLIAYGIYDIYTNEKIILKKLLRLIDNPKDRYDNEKWLKTQNARKLAQLKIKTKNEKQQKIKLNEKISSALSNNSAHFKINKELIGALLILTGIIFICNGFTPVVEMKNNIKETESLWEEIKQEETNNKTPMGMTSVPKENELIGMIKITPTSKKVGIRYGATAENLDYGAALDKNSSFITTSKGNSVLYGHREEIFWDLKNVKNGDIISIELPNGTLNYEIYDTFVVSAEDTSYYNSYEEAEITLVTCHPFIYMGPTPERFIVKAKLVTE